MRSDHSGEGARAPLRLSNATLNALPAATERPRYDRSKVAPGIVHLGLGAFSRSHLGVYTDEAIAAGDRDWGIVGVDTMSTALRDALAPQDDLYTVLVRAAGGDTTRVVGSLVEVMAAPADPEAVLTRMVDPATRIVTLTVTEKGYCQDAATGTLDEAHPMIVADLASGAAPRSVPGLLTEALRRRREAGRPPFTVLCCDNLPRNGDTARRVVTRFAERRDPELGAWVAANVSFPRTMVDRITPATQPEDKAAVAAAIGLEDACPVVTEPFLQWVVEDRFPLGRPRWEVAGALMVDDVTAYEEMKLRCLNGAHSTLAYLGVVLDVETISDAMSDPHLPNIIRRLWDEDVVPTLPPIPGIDPVAYTRALEERFRNPALRHKTLQISSDGSQKLPPRLLNPALERVREGKTPRMIALAIAAWMRFQLGVTETGVGHAIADPLAARLGAIAAAAGRDADRLAQGLFGVSDIFDPELVADPPFRSAVVETLRGMLTDGVRAALAGIAG